MFRLCLLRQNLCEFTFLSWGRTSLLRRRLERVVHNKVHLLRIPDRGRRQMGGGPQQQLSLTMLQLHALQGKYGGQKLLCEGRTDFLQKSRHKALSCVRRTSRDKASLWRPENLFAKVMQEVRKSIKKWSCEYLLLNRKNLWMLHILVIKRSKFTHFLESAYLSIRCHPFSLYWAFMATATCVCNALLFHFYGSLNNLWCV